MYFFSLGANLFAYFLMLMLNKLLNIVSDLVIEMPLLREYRHSLFLSDTATESEEDAEEKGRDI